jgi:hypothetical protein
MKPIFCSIANNMTQQRWKRKYDRHMSTALVYCSLSEGFVIATDSRAVDKLTGQIEDNERKIFAFENQYVSVVFAWAGIVKVMGSSFGAVSLVKQTYESLSRLALKNPFAADLAADLKRKLSIFTVNTSGPSAVGIFLSFVNGSPWVSQITVSKNGRTYDCSVDENIVNDEINIVSGPGFDFDKPTSVDHAKDMIELYIQKCIADEQLKHIGGDVCIGKFTVEGLDWLVQPKHSN